MLDRFRSRTINKSGPVPIYFQLKEILRDYIREQPAGALLPSETELCRHFAISRPTVRQAMSELAMEGYLYRRKGRGSFVARDKIVRNYVVWHDGFNEEIKNRGQVPSTKVLELEIVEADESVRSTLGLEADRRVVFLRRLRTVDDEPVLVLNSYLPYARIPGFLEKDLATRSLHSVLSEDYRLTSRRTRRILEAIGVSEPEAHLLHLKPGSPVQYFENTVYLDDRNVIEYSEGWYRGDRIRFAFEYEKSGDDA